VLSDAIGHSTAVHIVSGYLELVWIGAILVVFLIALRWAWVRTRPDEDPVRYSRRAVVLAALYALFAIGLDAVQSLYGAAVPSDPRGETLLGIAENSGELVTLSLMLGLTLSAAVSLARQRRESA
jgi:ABC-type Co2+ transport system permease subunit